MIILTRPDQKPSCNAWASRLIEKVWSTRVLYNRRSSRIKQVLVQADMASCWGSEVEVQPVQDVLG